MVKHIVMWKLKDEFEGRTKNELALELQKQLMALKGNISALKSIEVGINSINPEANSDVVLDTTFDNFDDLSTYATHPDHVKVGGFVKNIAIERRCVDFEF